MSVTPDLPLLVVRVGLVGTGRKVIVTRGPGTEFGSLSMTPTRPRSGGSGCQVRVSNRSPSGFGPGLWR